MKNAVEVDKLDGESTYLDEVQCDRLTCAIAVFYKAFQVHIEELKDEVEFGFCVNDFEQPKATVSDWRDVTG